MPDRARLGVGNMNQKAGHGQKASLEPTFPDSEAPLVSSYKTVSSQPQTLGVISGGK